jgi:arylsulfatase A-like enzyme
VTSDHGENFFERGIGGHRHLYEETARIPLIISVPGTEEARRVEGVARGIDLVPTLLDLLGIPAEGTLQGRSLASFVRQGGRAPEMPVASLGRNPGEIRTLRSKGLKYFQLQLGPTQSIEEIYDLGRDPRERHDLAKSQPARLLELRRAMSQAESEGEALRRELFGTGPSPIEVPEVEAERLRALGYAD